MKIFLILCDATESQESKMSAHKPEMLISQPSKQHNCKIPKATPMFSSKINLRKLFPILCDASGSRKSKMAALEEDGKRINL